jgi:hypothetical protein
MDQKNPITRNTNIVFAGFLVALTLWIFHTSLSLPYLSDDFEHVQLICEIRAGLRPWIDLLRVPFHGQNVVLLRLLFWFGTLQGHMSLTWVRIGVLAFHLAGALGCGVLCARWTHSVTAGYFGSLLYAVSTGFMGDLVSWPSSSIFCIGETFCVLSLLALSSTRLRPITSTTVSIAFLMGGVLGLNAEVVFAVTLCGYCWLVKPANKFWRQGASVSYLVSAAAVWVLWRRASRFEELAVFALSQRGFLLGAWLIFTAPLRYVYSWTTIPTPSIRMILQYSVLPWILLLAALLLIRPRLRLILALVWLPAVLLAFLVGMARAQLSGTNRYGPGTLYVDDRYYYPFLFPLATHLAFAFAGGFRRLPDSFRQWSRPLLAALTALGVLAGIVVSRQRYLENIPHEHYRSVGLALGQGRKLVSEVEASARGTDATPPLQLRDGRVPLDGAHRNSASLAFLIYSEFPHGIKGLRLANTPISERDAQIENSILDRWALAAGFGKPVACLESGVLTSIRASSRIDFQRGSFEEFIGSGFSWWEGTFRWITGEAKLRLQPADGDLVIRVCAPLDQLRRKFPLLHAIHVKVKLNGDTAGEFSITAPDIRDFRLKVASQLARREGPIMVELQPDLIWHSRDLDPSSLDDRDLSFALFSIGFGDRDDQSPTSCQAKAQ